MTVWTIFPSAAPIAQARLCVQAWHDMGYSVAVAVEYTDATSKLDVDRVIVQGVHPGYPRSMNALAKHVLEREDECDILVAASDDIFPDQKRRADELAAELLERFRGSLGVMQPTGDPWDLENDGVPQATKAAMSPWLGRGWCTRSYCGQGPFWPGYVHLWADNDLQEVAKKLRLYWQNPDVTQIHQHYLRLGNPPPPHAKYANDAWDQDKALFMERQAAGFPESELL